MEILEYSTQCTIRQCSLCQRDTEFYCNTCKQDLCKRCQKRHVTNWHTICHKVVLYRTHHCKKGFSTCYKVHQCFLCQGEAEFYCNTCENDLCLQCRDKHLSYLDTKHHDVVIYREKNQYIPRQGTCMKHLNQIYDKFCSSCKFPICVECKGHRKHKIIDLKMHHHQSREIIHKIRTETLLHCFFLLERITAAKKTCYLEISNYQTQMLTKAMRVKNLIDGVKWDVQIRDIINLCISVNVIQQKRKLASIDNYENRTEQLANKAVKFLFFLKKSPVPIEKDTPVITRRAVSQSKKINMEDVVMLLSEIRITETRKGQLRNEYVQNQIFNHIFHTSFRVTRASSVSHISCVTSNRYWISDGDNLILTNTTGDKLYHLTNILNCGFGLHTVTGICELIYIDRGHNIIKLSEDNTKKSTLLKKTEQWEAQCVYSSPFNGDLLVGLWNMDTASLYSGKVMRFNDTGKLIQKIEYKDGRPIFITENHNGDVIVSDLNLNAVVVTDREGRYRFSYKGSQQGSKLLPRGICTDELSHILVCDLNTHTVQMIDKDGQFLSLILTPFKRQNWPYSLSYNIKIHRLWVGSLYSNKVHVYKNTFFQENLTCNCY